MRTPIINKPFIKNSPVNKSTKIKHIAAMNFTDNVDGVPIVVSL